VDGLTVGGDDYVTKPFSIEELVARVRVVLRRHTGASDRRSTRLQLQILGLDEDTHEVFRVGRVVELVQHRVPLRSASVFGGARGRGPHLQSRGVGPNDGLRRRTCTVARTKSQAFHMM
jgi:hypothetical protein